MKKSYLLAVVLSFSSLIYAQPADSLALIEFNQQIDLNVVNRNVADLEGMYADDFVFSHGSGKVEGKQSWLKSVAKSNFQERRHDSVTVELHGNLAILKGKLSVLKKTTAKTDRYRLKYIRVFVKKEKWL